MNDVTVRVFHVAFLEFDAQFLLHLHIADAEHFLHVFLVHLQQDLTCYFFSLEYLDEIIKAFPLGKLDNVFSGPVTGQLLGALIRHKMSSSSLHPHYLLACEFCLRVDCAHFEIEFVECLVVDEVGDVLADGDAVALQRQQLEGEFCVFELVERVLLVEDAKSYLVGLLPHHCDYVPEAHDDVLCLALYLHHLWVFELDASLVAPKAQDPALVAAV